MIFASFFFVAASASNQVAFHAHTIINYDNPSDNTQLEFKNIIVNIGNSFNQTTSTFLTSVAGVYQFTATASARAANTRVTFAIVFENNVMSTSYSFRSGDALHFATAHLVYHLEVGQRVWVQHISGESYYPWDYCQFNGVLISPDVNFS